MIVTVKWCFIQCYLNLSRLLSMTCINDKATPINDDEYNCNITTIKLV